jgi:hypothetical protein
MKLHEKAIENFNEKAKSVLDKVKIIPRVDKSIPNLQLYKSGTISRKDIIGDMITHYSDDNNENCGFSVDLNGENVGIIGEDFREIKKFIETMLRNKDLSDVFTYGYIEKKYIEWFIGSITKKESSEFIDYLNMKSEKDVKEFYIWIPIPFTTSDRDFSFGNIEFKMDLSQQSRHKKC